MSQIRTPAYLRIKSAILTKIHAGEWSVGQVIPTEMMLAKNFGVARMTVNRALKELTDERVLERRQGSGTFVAQQKYNQAFVEIKNIAEDIRQQNRQYVAKVLTQKTLTAKDIATHPQAVLLGDFGFDDVGDEPLIFELKVLHIADGVPLQYEERWVNAKLLPSFIEQDFTVVNTSEFLITNLPLEYGAYDIGAMNASKDVAQALSLDVGQAVLLLERKTHSQGQVATVAKMWYAGDRHRFSGVL